MTNSQVSVPRPATAQELKAVREREQNGLPFLLLRDSGNVLQLIPFGPAESPLIIGRAATSGVALSWDKTVSRVHAELLWVEGVVILVDGGLSQNGTIVNGVPIGGRRRVRDGDLIQLGSTQLAFRQPSSPDTIQTEVSDADERPNLTTAQLRVLEALATPWMNGGHVPATNRQIAEELFVSVNTVKTHMRAISEKFSRDEDATNIGRIELVHKAFAFGLLTKRDGP